MDKYTHQYDESTLLFVSPGFRRGISRVIAPFGRITTYSYSTSGRVADTRAIRSDWRAVGRDILNAMKRYDDKQVAY